MNLFKIKYPYEDFVKDTRYKAWASYFVFKPLILRMSWFFANFTPLTSNQISLLGLGLLVLIGWLFYQGNLLLGGLLYSLRSILDHVDGRVARIKGLESNYGAYLDNASAMWGVLAMVIGFSYGQYIIGNDVSWLLIGMFLLFANWNHAIDSMNLKILLGKKFDGVVRGSEVTRNKIMNKFKRFLKKRNLAEPMNTNDWRVLTFSVFPVFAHFFGYLKELVLLALLIFLLKAIFWAIYYRNILGAIDRKSKKTPR